MTRAPIFRTRTQLCPACQAVIDAVTTLERQARRPKPGDVTICLKCAALLLFEDGLQVRQIQIENLEPGEDRDRAAEAVAGAKEFLRLRPK